MAQHNRCDKGPCNSPFVCFRSSLLLLLILLTGTAASHVPAAAAQGHNSSTTTTKRRLLQEALLPDLELDKGPASNSNSSSAPTCWGWKSTQCLTSGTDKPAFALLGDSITDLGFKADGWASLLQAAYGGAVNAFNYGIPGANTSKVDVLFVTLMEQWETQLQQVKLVTVCFGANDAVKPDKSDKHLPLPKFTDNLRRLVQRLREKGITRILLVTPPPVGKRNDRDNALTADYAAAVTELAKELHLDSVDVYSAIMAVKQWQDEALETDQLHLSSVGQKVLFDSVLQLLANSADLSPAALGAAQQPLSAEVKQAAVVLEQTPQEQRQQTQPEQQPQQQHGAGDQAVPEGGGKAMSNVLCILMVLFFLAVITEAKKVSQSPVSGDGAARKVAP